MSAADGDTAPVQAPDTHQIMKQTVTLMLFLMVAIFLTTIFTLFQTQNDLYRNAKQQATQLLTKALDNGQQSIRDHLSDNAAWNEAWENLHQQVNTQWAWDAQNLGESLFTTFGYDGVFVLSADGQTRYSVLSGRLQLVPFEQWLGKNVLAELRREVARNDGRAISRLQLVDDRLTLVAAAWITSEEKSASEGPDDHSLMIFAETLTPAKLAALGEEYVIHDLHMVQADILRDRPERADTLFPVSGGTVAFAWDKKSPGDILLTWVLPLLVLLMIISVLFALVLARKALIKARMNDEKAFLLERSRQALEVSERRFRDIVETTTDWIWEADEEQQLSWISARFPAITGYRINDWLGRSFHSFLSTVDPALCLWLEQPETGNVLTLTHCPYLSAQGSQRYCNLTVKRVTRSDGTTGFRGTATDVTLEVEASERIHYLSHHDELTGLPNRIQMKEFLEGRLQKGSEVDRPLAMISLDLNDFKTINDVYGHSAGDAVLSEVSARLRNCMRSTDLVARQGGDEFIIIAPDLVNHDDIDIFCRRIIEELRRPFYVCGNEMFIGASMGIALSPQHARTASDLLRYSDIALYEAKKDKNTPWVFYKPDMAELIVQRRELEQALREAIKENQLFLLYQPRYDIRLGRITSLEALVRWRHPRYGLLMPDQFIPLAEETGIIVALTDWVLTTACRDVGRHFESLSVSINMSPVEFRATDIAARVKNTLEATGFPASRLELEVTENVTLSRPEQTQKIMHELKGLGVRLLMDDFGTGYASLNYLRSFPFDGIKLDKSFIFAMDGSETAKHIVEKIIGLGKDFNLEVTAEGVESQEQLSQLKSYQCDIAQGYFISRPVTLEKVDLDQSFNLQIKSPPARS